MEYRQQGDFIHRIDRRDDLTATIVMARPGEDAFDAFAAALADQEANGQVLAPPVSPAPAPWSIGQADLPEGTRIAVRNASGEIFAFAWVDLSAEPLTLADPGAYEIAVMPPAPHRGYCATLELI